jgi:hypothetical protein
MSGARQCSKIMWKEKDRTEILENLKNLIFQIDNLVETHQNEGTVKQNINIGPVLMINQRFFLKIGVAIFGRFLLETRRFLAKIGNGTKNREKQWYDIY